MNSEVITIPIDATIKDALKPMLEKKTNGLVVVDAARNIKGVLTTLDIIRYIVPDYLEDDSKLASFESEDVFAQQTRASASHPITKIMEKRVKSVKDTHTLIEAAALMTDMNIRQLPVVDGDNKLVGFISRTNIKQAMGDVLSQS